MEHTVYSLYGKMRSRITSVTGFLMRDDTKTKALCDAIWKEVISRNENIWIEILTFPMNYGIPAEVRVYWDDAAKQIKMEILNRPKRDS